MFIGDSVTDGGWGRSGGNMAPSEERNQKDLNHIFGHGYMEMCAAHFLSTYPQQDLQFFNRGKDGLMLCGGCDDMVESMRFHISGSVSQREVIGLCATGSKYDIFRAAIKHRSNALPRLGNLSPCIGPGLMRGIRIPVC